jgi:3-hydroxyacyl-CoA dehydrogenase
LPRQCVPEKLELKRKVIAQLDELAPPDTIIASNSSSYRISEIIEGLKLSNRHRILSAHTYWPPETSAIELMGHQDTDSKIIPLLMDRCREHGFSPFHVKKDSMGYIYNRIWAAIKREALLTASEGVATPTEIDAIFKDVLKTPKGPFEQMDVVGLDVVLNIEEHYAEARPDIPVQPREYLEEFVKDGRLGVKSGQGFYEYSTS